MAALAGRKHLKSLLLTPHLDTVPAGASWKTPALKAKIIGKRIYGLGATDCKGNLASALEAINAIVEGGVKLDYDLIFAATADEESGSAEGAGVGLGEGGGVGVGHGLSREVHSCHLAESLPPNSFQRVWQRSDQC